ncbi:PIGC [Symbiodinium natans]|uniref:PIGC protein n=1 Tax=Symbiodinium natans TaxID=878477 RepID=A0A812SK67_9DINO|nr:PIGC [Symbiodinium natans]
MATKKEELPEEKQEGGKPSYTLHIRGLPSSVDLDELKIRLERFGEVVDIQQEEGTVVAKFSRTSEAFEAQQKLTLGPDVVIEFGPQDPDHYNRAKKRVAD